MKRVFAKRTRIRLLPSWHAFKVLAATLMGADTPIKSAAATGSTRDIERHYLKLPDSPTIRVSYLCKGDSAGQRVVFIHGTPGSAMGWAAYLSAVPEGRLYLALDRPGYGLTKPRTAVVSLKRQAQAIAPFIQAPGPRKAIVVGHSSGAATAIQTALDFPDAVGGLLILAGAVDPDLEEIIWLQPLGLYPPIARLLPSNIDTANRELLAHRQGLLAQADRLQKIALPITVVHGDKDPLVSLDNLNYLKTRLPRAELDIQVLKNADHFIPWQCKAAIDAALERLISRVGGSAS